jgi:tRNA-2-methylthio-N6-dimethylallyladenosine synthase
MNMRDSEFAAGLLLENGFGLAQSIDKADVVLFNSCSVRKHAEDRLFGNIWDLKKLKSRKKGMVIGLIGCTAQSYKEKAIQRARIIDFVCGPGNEADLPAIINKVLKNRLPVIATDKIDEKRPEIFPEYRGGKFKAYVSISEGCDNYCSYCIVPYVRGRERSRRPEDIIREVKDLAARGFKEITLLGQNVNSYKGEEGRIGGNKGRDKGIGFIKLLEELNTINGIERIRFMTSHPKDASVELFKAMRDLDKVCEHLHLPMQSGSDRILKLMNRGYKASKYLKLVDSYRKTVPGGSVTTDMVVGFPSETDKDFKKTYDIMKKAGFDSAFLFKYSPRPPAKAARLKDDVPEEEKGARLTKLLELQSAASERRNKPYIGKTCGVLVDGRNEKIHAHLIGRTRTNKAVVFEGRGSLIGKFVNVKVGSVSPYALKGRKVR